MKKLLSSLNKISETSINSNLVKNILDKVDFSDIDYKEFISGYDLSKYNKIIIKNKPLQIFLVTWPSQATLPVHQHNKYWGYIIVLENMLSESLYEYDDKNNILNIHPTRTIKNGEMIYEPLNIIHHLSNPSPLDVAVSIHFYYPPEYDYDGTLLFDVENQRLAELNKNAPNVSWNHPKEYYKRIEDNAFKISKMW